MKAEGPFFDELTVGQVFADAPRYTLTSGRAAVHQAIVGDRLRLYLDDELAVKVAGGPLAHPALVWDVAIGQSTVATHHVKANLFYRNLVFHRMPLIGDTLSTVTRVVGLRENARREGREPTGLAALRIQTTDQHGRTVLDFFRCAMLPLREGASTGHRDDLSAIGRPIDDWSVGLAGLDLATIPTTTPVSGTVEVIGGDVVSSAPELARLTLNVARVHHDATAAGGTRLVYGGHTIGLALAQAARANPGLVTVLGWHGCEHLNPVHEGDTLSSTVEVEHLDGDIVHLRSRVSSQNGPVLDWRFVALVR